MRVHGGEGAKWMNAFFQWLVHGEVEDINDSNSLHHNGHTIDNNKEELVHRKKQVRFMVRDTAVAVLEWYKNSQSRNSGILQSKE